MNKPLIDTDIRMRDLERIASYQFNWDGQGGQPASDRALSDARRFINNLPGTPTAPVISLASDGEVNLSWKLPNFKLDLGFYGDGTYSYYGEDSFGREYEGNEHLVSTPLPAWVLSKITAD